MVKIDNWVQRNDRLKEMKKIREGEQKQNRADRIDRVYDSNVEILKRKEIDWDERERRHMLEVRAKEDQREVVKRERK